MINTQQIKSALPIAKLIEHYGGIKTAANQCWCIFHEKNGKAGHKTPSLVVHPDSQTITCKSQGCFEGANIFAVIAKMEGLDIKSEYPKIIERAASIAGIQIQQPIRKPIMTGSLQTSHIEFLRNRGLEDETIAKMRLGGFYDHIQFKYFDNGEVVGYKAKTIIPKDKQDEHRMDNLKWKPYYIKGKKPDYWFTDGLQNKKIIYLVAGEYDLAILQQEVNKKNISNEIGVITLITGESSPISKSGLEYLRQLDNTEYRIIYDYDDTGLNNMPLRGQELLKTGKRVMSFSWKPEMNPSNKQGYDINDHFLESKKVDIFLDETNFIEIGNEAESQQNDAEKIELTNDPVTIDQIYEAISKIGVVSHELIEICIATCISIGLKLELPIWLMIIGNPSSFKTELIKLFRGIAEVLYLSSMSENAFASGFIPKDGSQPKDLLSILNNKILLIRDLTTMFSLNEETVKKILGDLTSIFDGEFEKFTATRGLMKYRATFPIIGCITPAILAKHRNYMEQLGSRFLFYRIPHLTDDNRATGYGIAWNGEKRSENIKVATTLVSSFCVQLINKARELAELPRIDNETRELLNNAAEFVSRARGKAITRPVEFTNDQNKKITYYEITDRQVEEPWRALIELRSIATVLAFIRNKDVVTPDEFQTLRLLIQSSASINRTEVMVALIGEEGLTADQTSKKVDKSSKQTRRDLTELVALGLVVKKKELGATFPTTAPWLFSIEPEYSALLAGISIAPIQEDAIPPNMLDEMLDGRDTDYGGGDGE